MYNGRLRGRNVGGKHLSSLTVCAGDLCGRLGVDAKSIEIQERPKPEI